MKTLLLAILLSACNTGSLFGVSKLTIITNDGQQFTYTNKEEIAALSCCKTIDDFINTFGHQEDITIPLSTINASCWQTVETYSKILFRSKNLSDTEKANELEPFLAALKHDHLYELIGAANFLNIPELLDSTTLNLWIKKHELTLFEKLNTHYQFNQNIGSSLRERLIEYLTKLVATDDKKSVSFIISSDDSYRRITSSCCRPDGKCIAVGSEDGYVKVWDSNIHYLKYLYWTKAHSDKVTTISYSPNSRYLASASTDDKNICLWDTSNFYKQLNLEGHTAGVNSVAFSPDSRSIASTSQDKTVYLWDIKTGSPLFIFAQPCQADPICYSPDGNHIAIGCDDGAVRIWDARTGNSVRELYGHSKRILSVFYSPDGHFLTTGSEDKAICIWNSQTGILVHKLPASYSKGVAKMCFSPDGNFIACSSDDLDGSPRTIQIWDTQRGKRVQVLKCKYHIKLVAYNRDGSFLISSSHPKTLHMWDARTGRAVYEREEGHCGIVCYHPNGMVVTARDRGDSIWRWNLSRLMNKHKIIQRLLLWLAINKKYGYELILNKPQMKKLYETFENERKEDIQNHTLLLKSA